MKYTLGVVFDLSCSSVQLAMRQSRLTYLTVSLLLACLHVCVGSARVYKAKAPKDYKDVQQEELGSIFGKGITLFGSKKETPNSSIADVMSDDLNAMPIPQGGGHLYGGTEGLKVVRDDKNPMSKKDKTWQASMRVLAGLSITYANKETGIIKTDESYIHDFDSTVSCKYRITINVSDNGEVSVFIKSNEDSQTRLKKHQESLKAKIKTILEESNP